MISGTHCIMYVHLYNVVLMAVFELMSFFNNPQSHLYSFTSVLQTVEVVASVDCMQV